MSEHTPLPWYRQFYPWLLVALLGSAVLASFASLAIALRNADSLVRSDWSEHGYRINDDIERQRAAARLGIAARIALDESGRIVSATVSGPAVVDEALALQLQHPTHAERDVALELRAAGENRFTAAADTRIDGTWDATLAPAGADWKLRRRVWLTAMQPAVLEPRPGLAP